MKHIEKRAEPTCLSEWKARDKMYNRGRARWNRLRPPEKTQLHEALISEQGAICCYCCCRIKLGDSHIEHFKPQGTAAYRDQMFEYTNLLCSCQLELKSEEPKHCGVTKAKWFEDGVIVSPLDEQCENRFDYKVDGSITGLDEGAKVTCEKLALDIPKMRELRKAAVSAIVDGLAELDDLSTEDIQYQIEVSNNRNPTTNEFMPFCIAVKKVLEKML